MVTVVMASFKPPRKEYDAPHSLASMRLAAYLLPHKDIRIKMESFDLCDRADRIADALKAHGPDIVCLPGYSWTERLSSEAARHLSMVSPHTLIVAGGPEFFIPSLARRNDWPSGSLFVSGEGEEPLLWLCQNFNQMGLAKPNGSETQLHPGIYTQASDKTAPFLMENLSTPVSLFSKEFIEAFGKDWGSDFSWWETARGCPYKCAFCSHKITGSTAVRRFGTPTLASEIENFKRAGIKRLYITDPNLGGSREGGKEILRLLMRNAPDISINCYLRPEFLDEEYLALLGDSNIQHVKIGIQTTNLSVPRWIRSNSLDRASQFLGGLRDFGVNWVAELIVGLPGDNLEGLKESLRRTVEDLRPSQIRAYRLSAFPSMPLFAIIGKTDQEHWLKISDSNLAIESNSYSQSEMEYMLRYSDAFTSLYSVLEPAERNMNVIAASLSSAMEKGPGCAIMPGDPDSQRSFWIDFFKHKEAGHHD